MNGNDVASGSEPGERARSSQRWEGSSSTASCAQVSIFKIKVTITTIIFIMIKDLKWVRSRAHVSAAFQSLLRNSCHPPAISLSAMQSITLKKKEPIIKSLDVDDEHKHIYN